MLKAKQKLLIWPEVRTRGETVVQNYGVETLNRDGQPLEKKGDVSFILLLLLLLLLLLFPIISCLI